MDIQIVWCNWKIDDTYGKWIKSGSYMDQIYSSAAVRSDNFPVVTRFPSLRLISNFKFQYTQQMSWQHGRNRV